MSTLTALLSTGFFFIFHFFESYFSFLPPSFWALHLQFPLATEVLFTVYRFPFQNWLFDECTCCCCSEWIVSLVTVNLFHLSCFQLLLFAWNISRFKLVLNEGYSDSHVIFVFHRYSSEELKARFFGWSFLPNFPDVRKTLQYWIFGVFIEYSCIHCYFVCPSSSENVQTPP